MARLGKRLATLGLGFVAALAALEALLQAQAWIVWARNRKGNEVAAPKGTRTILCVGDSNTYGLGASGRAGSYPSQLEVRLRNSGAESWRVVNSAWPGQNSWDVLRRLDSQLATERPRYVCLLVGINDFWARPIRHTLAEAQQGRARETFPLRWRTGRLLALLSSRLRADLGRMDGGTADPALSSPGRAPALVGAWRAAGVPIRFEEDGRLFLLGIELSWVTKGETLTVRHPEGAELEFRWRVNPSGLELLHESWTAPRLLPRDPSANGNDEGTTAPVGPALLHTLLAARSEDMPRELERLTSLGRTYANDPSVRAGRAFLLSRMGRDRDAAEEMVWLERRYAAEPGPATFEALAFALAAAGKPEDAVRLAGDFVVRYPGGLESFEALASIPNIWGTTGPPPDLVEEALRHVPQEQTRRRASLLRARSRLLSPRDPLEAAKDLVRAFLLERDERVLARTLRAFGPVFTPALLARGLDEVGAPPELGERIQDLLREARSEEGGVLQVLEAHLRQAVALCSARGARALLLSYPFPRPELEALGRNVAAETGCTWVDLRSEFDRTLRRAKREELFWPDLHCTDEGYRLIAQVVAAEIQRLEE